MSAADNPPEPGIRRALHDATADLGSAVLQLSLLLEDATIDQRRRRELEEALQSCRAAAARLRDVWSLLDGA